MPEIDPLAVPERIAFAGDWHMNVDWSREAVKHTLLCQANVIIHLGDFGYTFDAGFLGPLDRELKSCGLPLIFVDGNHEDHDLLTRYPIRDNGLRQLGNHIWHAPRGYRWEWGGVRFLACGGAYSIDRKRRVPGASWWKGEAITDDDVQRCVAGGPADVLVSHDCPSVVDIPELAATAHLWDPAELARANEHRRRLDPIVEAARPRWIWHGHYHLQYQRTADLGYGPVTVTSLDCDGTSLVANVHIVDLADLAATVGAPGSSLGESR